MTFKEFCKELLEEYGYIIFQYDSVISFTQTFPDTTCGLGGIGGQAFTDAQIFIFVNQSNRNAIVIGPAWSYYIENITENFQWIVVTIIWLELIILQELKNMVTLKKLKELKQIKRDNKVIYNLLNTIIGECEQISKDPSCSQVMDVIQKMYKDNKQTISECSVDRVDQLNTLNEENAFLESYLPQPLTKEELTALIGSQLTAGNNMSKIMKYLSEEYKGRYDGKVAVEIIKSLQ